MQRTSGLKMTKPKLYYTIGEVAKIVGVKTSTIRHWEKEFPQIRSSKRNNSRRLYNKKDLEKIKIIHYLLKEKKYTVEGAKKILKDNSQVEKIQKEFEVIKRLERIKTFLISLKENL